MQQLGAAALLIGVLIAMTAQGRPAGTAFMLSDATASVPALPASIGEASMEPDGTIVLRLRAEAQGVIGEGMLRYPPGDKQYKSILEHLGGLHPGEHKPVPPFP